MQFVDCHRDPEELLQEYERSALTLDRLLELAGGATEGGDVTQLELVVDTSMQCITSVGDLLPNLRELRMNDSRLMSFRDLGTSLRNLRVLWLARSGITDLDGISALANLTELYLAFNDVSDVTPLAMHDNIQVVDLESNDISDWNQIDQLGTCPELTSLNVEGNPVARLVEYRRFVVHHIPQLQLLDDEPVTNNDRLEVDAAELAEATRRGLEHRSGRAGGRDGSGRSGTGRSGGGSGGGSSGSGARGSSGKGGRQVSSAGASAAGACQSPSVERHAAWLAEAAGAAGGTGAAAAMAIAGAASSGDGSSAAAAGVLAHDEEEVLSDAIKSSKMEFWNSQRAASGGAAAGNGNKTSPPSPSSRVFSRDGWAAEGERAASAGGGARNCGAGNCGAGSGGAGAPPSPVSGGCSSTNGPAAGSSSSELTHGAQVVIAGNPVRGLRRRRLGAADTEGGAAPADAGGAKDDCLSITETLDRAAQLEQRGSEADWAAQLAAWDVEIHGAKGAVAGAGASSAAGQQVRRPQSAAVGRGTRGRTGRTTSSSFGGGGAGGSSVASARPQSAVGSSRRSSDSRVPSLAIGASSNSRPGSRSSRPGSRGSRPGSRGDSPRSLSSGQDGSEKDTSLGSSPSLRRRTRQPGDCRDILVDWKGLTPRDRPGQNRGLRGSQSMAAFRSGSLDVTAVTAEASESKESSSTAVLASPAGPGVDDDDEEADAATDNQQLEDIDAQLDQLEMWSFREMGLSSPDPAPRTRQATQAGAGPALLPGGHSPSEEDARTAGEEASEAQAASSTATYGKAAAAVSPDDAREHGEALGMTDEELIHLLKQKPKHVPMLKSHQRFKRFFAGMAPARLANLLERSYESLPEKERRRKIRSRMNLLESPDS